MKYLKIYPSKICQIAVGFTFAVLTPISAFAQVVVQSVVGSVQNGVDVVRIDFSEPLKSVPTGFSIQSPPRIALDFPNASNATGKNIFEVNQGNVKSVNVVQAGDRSRIVLNLKQPTSYQADIQGKSLLISLGTVQSVNSETQAVSAPVFADPSSSEVQTLKDVDFRRGADGSGRVVVMLPSSQVGVDIRQQGKGLVVDFLKSSLPEGLRRRLDVGDFGTPVQAITTVQQGERVRMTIDPVGDWEHSAYQSDSQFVVEIRQKKVDLNKLTQGPGYSGEKLSLNFQNIEVRSLLQVIADFTNFNIVTSDTVTGSLTLRLKDVPWDQALQIIMEAKGLGMRKSGTVLWIAPKDEIDDRTKKDYEAALAIQKLEPLRTQAFQMNYAKAVDMVAQLTASSGGASGGTSNRFLSERGSAIAEPRTNQLFVTDTASKLEEVRQLLSTLDVAVRQVMIEARIVEASDTFGRSLGVRLGGTDLRANRGGTGGYNIGGGNSVAFGTSYSNAVASSGAGGAANTLGSFVNLPAQAQGGFDPASFAISIFNSAANRFLNLEISAMEADGKGKIVSSPRVVTADQTKASIEQGTEFPYPVTAPNGGTVIAFKKAVLKLEVLPQITPEGNIILDLDVNKDSPGEILQNVRAINTKHIKTQVLVENGGTVVIGGIFELFEDDAEAKVPFLGDIPGVGNLFKTKTKQANKQEMLIFITPKVLTERAAIR
ncbi:MULTISPECIES: type IV pilus secretin family protein [Acidovorax]|jgi:type IV pilus assembly protein PilQ|uniref:Type IV pilus secretin PilQ n=1 Tax=Acidovorax facilis TaxID=12917 RepID=A0ABV8D3W0_9BURK|nr:MULTISPECIES: type IV pilus secretin family protein [Acidovorax]MBO1006249.1 type IV pilus secretin PilQ [Acidovorax sp. SD340]MCO4239902.1 type IV pilus secretin PilQ [Acidovorax facilis]